jgi:hypothetical protein
MQNTPELDDLKDLLADPVDSGFWTASSKAIEYWPRNEAKRFVFPRESDKEVRGVRLGHYKDRVFAMYSFREQFVSNAEYCYFLAWCDSENWNAPIKLGCFTGGDFCASTDGVLSCGADEETGEIWAVLPNDIRLVNKDREVSSLKEGAPFVLGHVATCFRPNFGSAWKCLVTHSMGDDSIFFAPNRLIWIEPGVLWLLGTGLRYSEDEGQTWHWLD